MAIAGTAVASSVLGVRALRRGYNRYGATDAELAMTMQGDALVPSPKLGYTRATTIDAPPKDVWSWLVQIGQSRGGLYSYDRLENLFGCEIHSATAILDEHQHLKVGDTIRSGPDTYPCWAVMQVVPDETLVLMGAGTPANFRIPEPLEQIPGRGYAASTWQWQLSPVEECTKTRLVVRQRLTYSPRQAPIWYLTEPINFAMEHKMLNGIKQRSETPSQRRACTNSPVEVRSAVATFDEGLLYARYLNEAADGAFRVLLGKRVGRTAVSVRRHASRIGCRPR